MLNRKGYECIELLMKINSNPYSEQGFFNGNLVVDHLDPYHAEQLQEIFYRAVNYGELYLFTKLRKKGRLGRLSVNRAVAGGRGTWHDHQSADVIDPHSHSSSKVVGKATKLSYGENKYPHSRLNRGRRFIMTEYTLLEGSPPIRYNRLRDYVVCHVRCLDGQRIPRSPPPTPEAEPAPAPEFHSPAEDVESLQILMSNSHIHSTEDVESLQILMSNSHIRSAEDVESLQILMSNSHIR